MGRKCCVSYCGTKYQLRVTSKFSDFIPCRLVSYNTVLDFHSGAVNILVLSGCSAELLDCVRRFDLICRSLNVQRNARHHSVTDTAQCIKIIKTSNNEPTFRKSMFSPSLGSSDPSRH